jgi:hypothetical protein
VVASERVKHEARAVDQLGPESEHLVDGMAIR